MSQHSLFDPSEVPTQTTYQDQLTTAIKRARHDGYIDNLDEGLVSLAMANAVALDQAVTDRKVYAIPQITAPYLEVLRALKLTPESRDTQADDALTQALAELSRPTVCD